MARLVTLVIFLDATAGHFRVLLSSQGHLSGHNPLPFHHEEAIGALAFLPPAELLVAFEAGDDPVIPAPGALWSPEHPLTSSTG